MVRVQLKGVHTTTARLKDGTTATYFYAWKGKGAPRLPGSPGSPEFVAAFAKAHSERKRPTAGFLAQLVADYRASPEYTSLSTHTLRAYAPALEAISVKFGTMTLAVVEDKPVRKLFIAWRNELAKNGRLRSADMSVGVLKRLLSWAESEGRIETNHAAPIGRLHRVSKDASVWSDEDLAAFAKSASPELVNAVRLAAYTGLRQGDLCKLAWNAYDGQSFALRTSKRGRQVLIPATAACRALMQRIPKRSPQVLTSARHKERWTPDGLRSSFGKACKEAGIKRTFHDLRRTAATHLLTNGIERRKVAMIMGWGEADVEALERIYVSRSAIVKSVLAQMGETE